MEEEAKIELPFPEDRAFHRWHYRDAECFLVCSNWLKREPAIRYASQGNPNAFFRHLGVVWYCGYARWKEDPFGFGADIWHPLIQSTPVHGGVTYARYDESGFVLGFDCNHAYDCTNPDTWNWAYLKNECKLLVDGVNLARAFADLYKEAESEWGHSVRSPQRTDGRTQGRDCGVS